MDSVRIDKCELDDKFDEFRAMSTSVERDNLVGLKLISYVFLHACRLRVEVRTCTEYGVGV